MRSMCNDDVDDEWPRAPRDIFQYALRALGSFTTLLGHFITYHPLPQPPALSIYGYMDSTNKVAKRARVRRGALTLPEDGGALK